MARDPGPDGRTGPARLVLADDHDLVREGLYLVLSREPDLEVVGEASDGREAVEVCRKLKPDLVLMDVRMPEMDGLEATREIKREQPSVSVLVVTTHENPDYLLEALKAGAAGYVLKGATQREIITTVRQVLRGESALQPELAARLLRRLANEGPTDVAAPAEQLTPREREVLRLVAQGRTNQEIGRELTLSVSTVKTHLEHIIAKLGVSDRTHAAVRAAQLGLLAPA